MDRYSIWHRLHQAQARRAHHRRRLTSHSVTQIAKSQKYQRQLSAEVTVTSVVSCRALPVVTVLTVT
ncbi:hypothetical protein [Streptomyces hokutonensis]|uniref:hypothetical protein n=1 Tax=Streptomyces hokutonensis TaxID=1306990 RepID=UPI0038235B81